MSKIKATCPIPGCDGEPNHYGNICSSCGLAVDNWPAVQALKDEIRKWQELCRTIQNDEMRSRQENQALRERVATLEAVSSHCHCCDPSFFECWSDGTKCRKQSQLPQSEPADDGERVTPEWMAQQLGQKLESRSTIWLNGSVNIVADTAWCGGEQLCSIEYRFQFHNLCKALGIDLNQSSQPDAE